MKRLTTGCLFVLPMVLLMTTGCADPKQKQIDDLNSELQKVRGDLDEAQRQRQQADAALAAWRQQYQGLESERAGMASELGMLRQQLDAARAEAAKPTPTTRNGWVVTPGASMISIESDLLFASGKADLTAAGKRKLAEVAREIKKEYASRDIYVIGHTDKDPIRKSAWKDNWELSTERALTVGRTLQGAGVAGRQIMVAGRSEYHPVGTAKAKNRRVEIYAVEAPKPAGRTAAR